MAKVLILFADGLEEMEAVTPADLLRRAGVEVTTASISDKLDVTGAHDIVLKADTLLKKVLENTYDMLILPGGGVGTQNLAASSDVSTVVKSQYDAERHVAAICAAPTILPKMGIKGHEMTCYPTMEKGTIDPDLFRTDKVVVSTNGNARLITSRGPGTAIPFALELIKTLKGEAKMQEIKEQIVF